MELRLQKERIERCTQTTLIGNGPEESSWARGFLILRIGIIVIDFQMEEKENRPGRIKDVKKKIHARTKVVL